MSIKVTQHSFAGGQLDRALLGGRQDLQKYYTGATSIENYIVQRQGCLTKRPGTDFCFDATARINDPNGEYLRLIPFVFNKEYGYAILFSPGKITIYTMSGEQPQEIDDSPYVDSDIYELGYCQSGDILFLASKQHAPHKLTRAADGTFSLSELVFANTLAIPAIDELTLTGETIGTANRTISYCVTAVHTDGESLPSPAVEISYQAPWAGGQIVTVDVAASSPAPLYYNIYKKTQNYFGLIGTTATSTQKLSQAASACTCTPKTTNASSSYLWKKPLWDAAAEVTAVFQATTMTAWGWKKGAVLVTSGNIELTLTRPTRFSRLRIGIGYMATRKYKYHATNTATYWKTCLYATGASKLSVTVTYDDNQNPITASSALFDQITGGAATAEVTHATEGVSDNPNTAAETTAYLTLSALGHKQYIDIDLPAETRKATKILIKGWTNDAMTTACSGDIGYTASAPDSNGYRTNTITYTGNPLLVNGVEMFAADGSVLSFTDDYITPNVAIGIPKQTELFKDSGDFPGLVSIYQQRLIFASSIKNPSKYWMSRPGNLYDFSTSEIITESDPIIASLPLTKGPNINHLVTHRDIHMFCESSEWLVKAVSGNALSYKTVLAEMQSASGSADWLPPITCGTSILFVEKSGKSVREYKYDYAADGFAGRDISVMASSIFDRQYITSWAYQQHPNSILWCVLNDYTMVGLTYMPEEEVYAWFKTDLGYPSTIRSICATEALPPIDGAIYKTSEIFLLVSRSNDHYIERFRVTIDDHERMGYQANLDCCRKFIATEQDVIPYEQIAVNANTSEVVTALEVGKEYVTGYPIKATLTTISPEIPSNGTLQNTIKCVVSADIRVQYSAELFMRLATQTETEDQPIPQLSPVMDWKNEGTPEEYVDVLLAEGDFNVIPLQANSTDGRVTITDKSIFGSTILSVSTNLSIQPTDGMEG